VAYVQQVHQQVLAEHRETVAGVVDAGAAVASAVERRPVTDGDRLIVITSSRSGIDRTTACGRTGKQSH
jgi:hypothetical protein